MSVSAATGTYFVLPPRHRLFVVFDDPTHGREAVQQLCANGNLNEDNVWTFYGEEGVQSVDPSVRHHGLPIAIVRIFQRVLTNDCEYCEGLAQALRGGAMVLAIKTEEDAAEELSRAMQSYGGHSFAYGEHWNFVPLGGSGQTIGSLGESP